jgi:hypothetical protein
MNLTEGMLFIPPESNIKRVCEFSRAVVHEEIDGKCVADMGCWILCAFKGKSNQIISQIPRDVLADDQMRSITFGEVVPQMIRESGGKAFAFLLPMMYATSYEEEADNMAIRVLAFNGIHFIDFYCRGSVDEQAIFTIEGWGIANYVEGVGEELIHESQRAIYRFG